MSSTATTTLALPVVMSHACSALIAAGAVEPQAADADPAGGGGFRYHWPTAGPPLVAVTAGPDA